MYSERSGRRLLCLSALLMLLSCSIREDRADCPCLLILDFSSLDGEALFLSGRDEVVWSVRSGDFQIGGRFQAEDLPPEYVVEIPRETACLIVAAGDEGLYGQDVGVLAPEGEPFPPLSAFVTEVDGTLPELTVPVALHKRYAVLDILFRDMMQDGASYAIVGEMCGYGPDLEPVPGRLYIPFSPDGEGRCSVAVPAQTDGSLAVCVYRYGELERVFSLGACLPDSGYDWFAEDLEDISLEIDYVDGTARIKFDQWSKSVYFTIAV